MEEIDVRWLGRTSYSTALDLQNQLVNDILAGHGGEKLLLLEHEPVYTIGRTRDQSSLRQPASLPHPIFEINRGGQATWHGPGQLVAYPILNLQHRGRDLHRYLRFLEDIVILTSQSLGINASRRENLTGVWVEDRKLASIGVGVRKWISMHGLALNVTADSLSPFEHITPCGIAGVHMTSLQSETSLPQTVHHTASLLSEIFLREISSLSDSSHVN